MPPSPPRLAGSRFGRLLVVGRSTLRFDRNGRRHYEVPCRCDCGEFVKTLAENLISGATRSCGCLRLLALKKARKEYIRSVHRRWQREGTET